MPKKSRFNRPSVETPEGIDVEDLADFAVHTEFTEDQIQSSLQVLFDKYFPSDYSGTDYDLRKRAYFLWGLEETMRPDLMRIEEEYRRSTFQACQVYQQLLKRDLLGNKDHQSLENSKKINMVFEALFFIRDLLTAEQRWKAMCDPSIQLRVPEEIQIFKFSPFDYSTTTTFQNFLIYLLRQAYLRGYRKLGEFCYSQIRTAQGYNSHAWKKVCSIREFVHSAVQKETNFEMWKALTNSGDAVSRAVIYLMQHDDVEFPKLELDRHIFAFRNGLLFLGKFTKDERSINAELQPPSFFPFATHPVSEAVIACKFFDLVFEFESFFDHDDWYAVPTPACQSILDYQEFPEYACRMKYIMLGRVMYDLNEYDNWQVLPFDQGVANCGKSTLLRMVYSIYQPDQVGIMSSRMEKNFWAMNLYDKFIWLCLEARSDFSIDQGQFQSAISGEEMTISIKHAKPINLTWTAPGLMAGNEPPGFVDAALSMSRRYLVWKYWKMVRHSDPTLLQKLRAEMPAFLYKCNMAYLEAVQEHGKQPIWEWQGEYFSETQNEMASKINPLKSFVEQCDELVLHPDLYLLMDEFRDLFFHFCDTRKFTRRAWTKDMYAPVFEMMGLAERRKEKLAVSLEETNPPPRTFVFGLTSREQLRKMNWDSRPEIAKILDETTKKVNYVANVLGPRAP